MTKLLKWLVLPGIIIMSFGFLLAPSPVKATGIQISPLTFNLDIPTASSGGGHIVVTNVNAEPMNYVIEVENFAGVSEDGAVSFAGPEEPETVTNLSDWFTFDAPKEGTLEAKKDITINFTIAIPTGAEPGGHYAAVFAREVKKNPTGQAEIGVTSRVGALVLVNVPGTVTKTLAVTNFTYPKFVWHGPNELILNVKNTGSTHFDSKAEVQLKSIIGKTTTVDLGKHTLIPDNDRRYIGKWATKYPFGYYKVTATALDGDGKAMTATGAIWAIPLVIVIPIIILLILIIILIKFIKRHFKYSAKPIPAPKQETPVE